jgi:hypothetical protein
MVPNNLPSPASGINKTKNRQEIAGFATGSPKAVPPSHWLQRQESDQTQLLDQRRNQS